MSTKTRKQVRSARKSLPIADIKTNTLPKHSFYPWLPLVTGITAICFIPMLRNGFTNWDDQYYILQNTLLNGPDWKGIFTNPVVSNYHPLTIITLAFNYAISGMEPWSYHLANLVLHVLNTALVFVFAYRLSSQKVLVAFLTALAFGIHPMHVESVAWASERKDVLYAFFFLLSLMEYLRYLQTNKASNLWLCFVLFVMSLLSKPSAIILPFVLLTLDYWKNRPITKKALLEKTPFFFVSLLFTVVTINLQSVTAMVYLNAYPFWNRLLFASFIPLYYLVHFFIPYPLSAYHPFPPVGNLGWQVYCAPVLLMILLFFVWRYRKSRSLVFGFLFFIINIALVLQITPIGFTLVAERYTYVPYIGIAFMISMLFYNHFASKNKVAWTIAIALFAFFSVTTSNRTKTWNNSNTLWSDVIEHYPNEPLPRADRAQYLYNLAITMDPREASTLFEKVIEDCTVAINNQVDSLNPEKDKGGTSIYNMRGTSFYYLNKPEKAVYDFSKSISINSNDPYAYNFRGTVYFNKLKEYDKALADFTKAIQLQPNADYIMNRSRCYYMLGDLAKARENVNLALQKGAIAPDNYRKLLGL